MQPTKYRIFTSIIQTCSFERARVVVNLFLNLHVAPPYRITIFPRSYSKIPLKPTLTKSPSSIHQPSMPPVHIFPFKFDSYPAHTISNHFRPSQTHQPPSNPKDKPIHSNPPNPPPRAPPASSNPPKTSIPTLQTQDHTSFQ